MPGPPSPDALTAAALTLAAAVTNLVLKTRLRFPWVLADSYTHLYMARAVRRIRAWPQRLDKFLFDAQTPHRLDYPPLFGLLLALLLGSDTPSRRLWLARWLPGILDTAALLTAAAGAYWVAADGTAVVLAAWIWALAPCTHAQTLALSGRPLGALLATATFSGLASSLANGTGGATAIAIGAGALLFLANRLAVQAWALLTLALTAMIDPIRPPLLFVGALLVAGALTFGLGWRVHLGHWRHMRRLRLLMPKKGWHQLARFSARRAVAPPRRGWRLVLRVVSFLDLPFAWLLPLAAVGGASWSWREPVVSVCLVWVATLTISGAVIQAVPAFRFVGEGFRYFEFAIVPLAVLLGRALGAGLGSRGLLALGAVPVTVLALWQVRRAARASYLDGNRRDERAVALAQRLRQRTLDRLLVIPLPYAPLVTVEAEKSTLMMLAEVPADRSVPFFPVMERPPAEFVAEFGIEGAFLDRRYVDLEELGLEGFSKVDEEGPFALYARTVRGDAADAR